MKIQDVRIGSWVRGYYDEDRERKYRDFKVVNILGRLEEVESEEGEIFHIDDCDGIPLTEEMLKANLFKKEHLEYEEYMWTCSKGCTFLTQYYTHGVICLESTDIELNYVHELQNALTICKLYDLADNFKIMEEQQ